MKTDIEILREHIKEHGLPPTPSRLQRRFQWGYARAANALDAIKIEMEEMRNGEKEERKMEYTMEDGKEVGVPHAIRDAVQIAGDENLYPMLTIFDYDKETQILTLDGDDKDLVDPIAVNGVENALEERDDVKRVEWFEG